MSGLRVKQTYDNIIAETLKPVKVKYSDRRAETTFNSHLFGQVRDNIDETEKAQQMAEMSQLAMQRAATLSNQSFQSVAASVHHHDHDHYQNSISSAMTIQIHSRISPSKLHDPLLNTLFLITIHKENDIWKNKLRPRKKQSQKQCNNER
jgi:hypothetical protein